MKLPSSLALLCLALSFGCSKKEPEPVNEAATAAEQPVAEQPAEAAPAQPASATAAKDWDKVVAEILQLRRPGITDAQRDRMLALQDELASASASDPAAATAFQNLSRIINQR